MKQSKKHSKFKEEIVNEIKKNIKETLKKEITLEIKEELKYLFLENKKFKGSPKKPFKKKYFIKSINSNGNKNKYKIIDRINGSRKIISYDNPNYKLKNKLNITLDNLLGKKTKKNKSCIPKIKNSKKVRNLLPNLL